MVIDSQKAYKNLKKKGFTDAPGDHKFLEFFHEGVLVLSTKISHGAKHDIGEPLINKMAAQCKLDKKDFVDLANCPLSEEEYIKKLINKGGIIDSSKEDK